MWLEENLEETKFSNACYHSVQNSLPSCPLSENIKIRMYKTIMLHAALYECKTMTHEGKHRLRVFENRELRRILELMRDQVKGEWRKLHNEELHNLHSSPSIIRMVKSRSIRRAGHVAQMGAERNTNMLSVRYPDRDN
jgi:hypothetical protein